MISLRSMSSRPVLRLTQPPIQWVPGVKGLGREADHTPSATTEVKTSSTHLDPEEGGSIFVQNVDIHLQDHMALQPRRPQYDHRRLNSKNSIVTCRQDFDW
jgi:hypothetical protein